VFEHHTRPLLPVGEYRRRLLGAAGVAIGLVAVSLAAGMVGYHWFESQPWLDAFVSASMILSGMGPVGAPQTVAGKLFSGSYALYSGFVALVCVGVLGAPVLHRFLHRFHLEDEDDGGT
jgi:hypothetical protein